jgi:hypothetical protein
MTHDEAYLKMKSTVEDLKVRCSPYMTEVEMKTEVEAEGLKLLPFVSLWPLYDSHGHGLGLNDAGILYKVGFLRRNDALAQQKIAVAAFGCSWEKFPPEKPEL